MLVNLQLWKKFHWILYQRNDTEFKIHQYHSPKLLLLKKFLSLFVYRLSSSELERVKKAEIFVGEPYIHVYVHIQMCLYFRITFMFTYIRTYIFICLYLLCMFTSVLIFIFFCKEYIYVYIHICTNMYSYVSDFKNNCDVDLNYINENDFSRIAFQL